MAINWPSGPSVGQLYPVTVSPGSPQWIWNGDGWAKIVNAGQIVSVLITIVPVVETTVSALPAIANAMYSFTYL